MKKLSAIINILICSSLLTACGGGSSTQGDGSGQMYTAALLNNPKSLDPQYADDESSNTVIANLYSGLMSKDSSGNVVCCNAESYTMSSDGLTYTFNLKDNNYWFSDLNDNDKVDVNEYFSVVADDYVFAFQRILDPEMQSPYSESFSCIKGGQDAINGAIDVNSIGVSAPDDHTVIIELEYPSADFINLLATNAAMPCNEEFFLSTKGRYGLDDKSVMSNGAFFVRQWFYDAYGNNNILYMKKNSANSSNESKIYPSFLSFTIEKSQSNIEALLKDDKIDCITSTTKGSYSKRKFYSESSRSITLGLIFNPNDAVYSNSDIHKAIAYSIDRAGLQEELDDDVQAAYGIIPPAVTLLGRSYRELSSDKLFDFYNETASLSCLESAKTALNIESFDTVKILVSTDNIDSGYLHLLSQQWQELFGYYIGVEEVTDDEFKSRITSGDYQIALYPLKGEYNSGVSVLEQLSECGHVQLSDEATSDIMALKACPNASEFADRFSSTEQKILNEFNFIPLFYKNSYLIMKKGNQDIIYDSFSGAVDYRIAKNFD